jgi:hypothetical protein
MSEPTREELLQTFHRMTAADEPVRKSYRNLFEFTGPHGTFLIKKHLIQGVRIQDMPSGERDVRILLPHGVERVYQEYLDGILHALKGDSDQYE